jgi:ketosteroid isomerase-like protein
MVSLRAKSKESRPLTGEEIVARYFRYMDNKDLDGILDLFDYDAVVYEPFSKVEELHGRSAIEPFFKVAMMANNELRRTIKIEKTKKAINNNNNEITALTTFEKGDKVKGRFTFEFIEDDSGEKRVKSLHIEFL